jgi:hypothetical protein
VRIEFEQVSRNFRDHGHDPAGCELIVCWGHSWAECPVEMLELRAVARQTRGPYPGVLAARASNQRRP